MGQHLEAVVAANVRRLRISRGWSQADLHRALTAQGLRRWSAATVALVETGRQRADRLADLAALCSVFGVPLADLIAGDDTIDTDTGAVPLCVIRDALAGRVDQPADPFQVDELHDVVRTTRRLSTQFRPHDLMLASLDLFGRWDFNAMRNEMVETEDGADDDPRSIQARRGHVTRRLLEQLAEHIRAEGLDAIRERNTRPMLTQLLQDPRYRDAAGRAQLRALLDEAGLSDDEIGELK